MEYTVILFDPLQIDLTNRVNSLFEEVKRRDPKLTCAENDINESGCVYYVKGRELGDKYKQVEQDFLRVKVYDIPEGVSVKSTAGAYWEKSSISKRYRKKLQNWR